MRPLIRSGGKTIQGPHAVTDAPLDGKQYVRKDGEWSETDFTQVVQTTGTSTTDLMSQKAVTDALATKAALSALEQLEVSITSLEQRVDALEQQCGDVGGRTITVEAGPDNSANFYDYGFIKSMSFGAVSDEIIDGRGEITELYWGAYLDNGSWERYISLSIEHGTDLDLVTAAKVTINSTVFTLGVYGSVSDFVQLDCEITEEQFNSLPQSGTHALQVELLP